ncbi:MAG: LysR family transcriptional regulator [Bacteroidetes bacterium]|nr:LysR family transcriptional regulator [Bacteroidota bacterium]
MDYTLNQLRIFLKVVEFESITKAAEALHLTQPAVSIQLKNLQGQFDIPLVEVIGRKLFVTEFGHELADSVQRILDEVEDIKNKTLSHKGLLVGSLKFASASTGKYVMPYFLTDFAKRYNGVQLNMDVTNKSTVLKHLEQNDVDFALVSVLPTDMNIERIELMQNKLYMIRKNEGETLAKPMKPKAMEDIQFLYREKGSATRTAMESYISSHKVPLNKTILLSSNEAVKQAVLAGLGYSLMPLIGLKNELTNNELEIVPMKDLPIITHWNIIWLKDKKLSLIAKAYLAFLEENKKDIMKRNFNWYDKY